MVSETNRSADGAVHGHRLSTVVPSSVTHDNADLELTGSDLAMKLHYLRAVYYFGPGEAVQGLTTSMLKEPMFPLLDIYFPVAGRIRRNDTGRPHVKCNDGGVRIVEAWSGSTVEEWLGRREVDRHRQLVPEKVVGPDLHFSPTVFIQFTWFKCGGMAVGFSWAHLLGDAVSASNCINLWGQLLSRKEAPKNLQLRSKQKEFEKAEAETTLPLSVKQVKQVGDLWLSSNGQRMSTFFIELPESMLTSLQSKMPANISAFETVSAIFWQCIAKIRAEKEPKVVTVCRNSSPDRNGILGNEETLNAVVANSSPANADLLELANLMNGEADDEMKTVEEVVNREAGKLDVVVYGANLTFVDMESIRFYDLEIKGQKPLHVECSVDGVGGEGAVLVLQGPDGAGSTSGRLISLILPEDEIPQLRELLENEWGIA